jgi:uncharacterized protein YidB (DUF937 family)
MGISDDAVKEWQAAAVPKLNVALGALILGKMFEASSPASVAAPKPSTRKPELRKAPAGSILGGLKDLIGKLSAGGVGPQVNSWVSHEANEPVQPVQLGSALGQNVINELSQRTGMNQQELLKQLAAVLPQIISHLTPNGRMPTWAYLDKNDSPALLVGTGKIRTGIPRVANWSVTNAQDLISADRSVSGKSNGVSPNIEIASQLLELILDTDGASVPVTKVAQKLITDHDDGVAICLAVACALVRDKSHDEAQVFCRNVHRILLKSGRDQDVPLLMLFQARLYERQGNRMARDLYAVEAGSGFVEFRDLKGVSAALELIDS